MHRRQAIYFHCLTHDTNRPRALTCRPALSHLEEIRKAGKRIARNKNSTINVPAIQLSTVIPPFNDISWLLVRIVHTRLNTSSNGKRSHVVEMRNSLWRDSWPSTLLYTGCRLEVSTNFSCADLCVYYVNESATRESDLLFHNYFVTLISSTFIAGYLNTTFHVELTLRWLMSYIYIWSTHSWCF